MFIGLDVGTSGCKASVMDECGRLHYKAERIYRFCIPRAGWVELDPAVVWENVKMVLKEIVEKGFQIRAIAVSSIGESVIPVDGEGNVLFNGITYLDTRGSDTVEKICKYVDSRVLHEKTGVPLNPMYTLSKMLWMKGHRPDVLEKAEYFFMFGDYIGWKLSGERMIDPSSASRTMLFDAQKLEWYYSLGEIFEIPLDKFSKVYPTGTVMGKILPLTAKETGLSEDVLIILGCHDQCSALLGSGALQAGDVMAGEGSTESINMIVNKESFCDTFFEKQLCFEPYLTPDLYIVPVGQLTHGTSIRWFAENIGFDFGVDGQRPGESEYQWANRCCADDCGELFFLPYLSKVKSMDRDNHALGVFVGIETSTRKAQMYRALLEGLAFESKVRFDLLTELGVSIRNITAAGGCSKSEIMMQMKADVLQEKMQILENSESGGIGLAMICAVSLGYYRNYAEAAERFVKIKKEYIPQKDYSEKYRKYCMLSRAAKELYRHF
ncbi:MAG: FGGY family carbohydrate kinase [Lachnospiraceae bacterium]|nr:FGGY family carbohydrate kinase [Lachnospiraceae bacterium]